MRLSLFIIIFALCMSPLSQAAKGWPRVSPLTFNDQEYLKEQRTRVNRLMRFHIGQRLRGNRTDVQSLQRIVNSKKIDKQDQLTLQALGVALGDALANAYGLQWVLYEDLNGRSRALHLKNSEYYIFPVTMISRRYRVGAKVEVQRIYSRMESDLQHYLPKGPYEE